MLFQRRQLQTRKILERGCKPSLAVYLIGIFSADCWGGIEALFEFVVLSQASKYTAMFFTKADVGL